MSVDKTQGVQNFKTWLAGQSDDVKAKPKSEARALFKQAKTDYKKGLEVERQAKIEAAEANGRSVAEFAKEEGYEAPLYKNKQARKELRQQAKKELGAFGEKLADTIDDETKKAKFLKKYEKSINKTSKQYVKNEAIRDRITHTQLYETRDEARAARKAAGEAADDFRFKKLPKAITDPENEVMQRNIEESNGDLDTAVKHELYETVGEEFKLNKGIEREAAFANLGVSKNAAGTAARRAGFGVDSRVQIGDILKPLAVGAGAGLTSNGISAIVDFVSEFHMYAENFTGQVDVVHEAEVGVHPWKSALAGGATAAALSALFASTGSNEENLLRGLPVEEAARRPDKLGKKGTNFRTLVEYMNQKYGIEETAEMLQDAASGAHAIPTLNSKEAASLFAAMAYREQQSNAAEQTPEPAEQATPATPATPITPAEENSDEAVQTPAPPAQENSGEVEPTTPEPPATPTEPEPQPEPAKVLVNNGDTMKKIADRFGVSVEELIELNKGVLGLNSGHIDCEDVRHKYLVAGKQITLPGNANASKVEEYNKVYTADKIKGDYTKYVTGEKFLEKNRNCYRNIKAAGPEAEKAFKDKIVKEARSLGLQFDDPKNADEVRALRDRINNHRRSPEFVYNPDGAPDAKTMQ